MQCSERSEGRPALESTPRHGIAVGSACQPEVSSFQSLKQFTYAVLGKVQYLEEDRLIVVNTISAGAGFLLFVVHLKNQRCSIMCSKVLGLRNDLQLRATQGMQATLSIASPKAAR